MAQRCGLSKKADRDDVFGQIDANLRRVFEEDAAEDLPPRLMELLEKLDKVAAPAPGTARGPKGRTPS